MSTVHDRYEERYGRYRELREQGVPVVGAGQEIGLPESTLSVQGAGSSTTRGVVPTDTKGSGSNEHAIQQRPTHVRQELPGRPGRGPHLYAG
jgi:hypothetical protein